MPAGTLLPGACNVSMKIGGVLLPVAYDLRPVLPTFVPRIGHFQRECSIPGTEMTLGEQMPAGTLPPGAYNVSMKIGDLSGVEVPLLWTSIGITIQEVDFWFDWDSRGGFLDSRGGFLVLDAGFKVQGLGCRM